MVLPIMLPMGIRKCIAANELRRQRDSRDHAKHDPQAPPATEWFIVNPPPGFLKTRVPHVVFHFPTQPRFRVAALGPLVFRIKSRNPRQRPWLAS